MGVYIAHQPQGGAVELIEKYASRDAFGIALHAWATLHGVAGPRGKGFAELCTWAMDNNVFGVEEGRAMVYRIKSETAHILVREKVAAFKDHT